MSFVPFGIFRDKKFEYPKKVQSSGMAIHVEDLPNLVIAPTAEVIRAGGSNEQVFSLPVELLRPATHGEIGTVSAADCTGLNYNTNPGAVSYTTGLALSEAIPLNFADVPVYVEDSGKPRYYVDYEVYVACKGKPMEVQHLNVTLSTDTALNQDHFYAASVDF